MYVPSLGPSVPKRGNALSHAIGRAMMTVMGWKFEGAFPDEPRFVMIIAPHTSNWDFIVGLWAYFALGFRASFLGKHTIFNWPLGPWIGFNNTVVTGTLLIGLYVAYPTYWFTRLIFRGVERLSGKKPESSSTPRTHRARIAA